MYVCLVSNSTKFGIYEILQQPSPTFGTWTTTRAQHISWGQVCWIYGAPGMSHMAHSCIYVYVSVCACITCTIYIYIQMVNDCFLNSGKLCLYNVVSDLSTKMDRLVSYKNPFATPFISQSWIIPFLCHLECMCWPFWSVPASVNPTLHSGVWQLHKCYGSLVFKQCHNVSGAYLQPTEECFAAWIIWDHTNGACQLWWVVAVCWFVCLQSWGCYL